MLLKAIFLYSWLIAGSVLNAATPPVRGMSPDGLIKCGNETVYIGFNLDDGYGCDNTVSPDGRYAFGWTLRPAHPGIKPVDWSKWGTHRNQDFNDLFSYVKLPNQGSPPYRSVNCIVDLKTNRIFDLPVKYPYDPEYTHADVRCAWSQSKTGPEYSLIAVNGGWFTEQLLLVRIEDHGLHEADLTDRLDKAVVPIIRDKRPLEDYRNFRTTFQVWHSGWKGKDRTEAKFLFKNAEAEIPFSTDITHSARAEDLKLEVDGAITVRLPEGEVIKVTSDTPRDNPFLDDPELARADREMNITYAELFHRLAAPERKALREEQLQWIQDRNGEGAAGSDTPGAEGGDLSDPRKMRNQSYMKSTRERTQELAERLKERN